MHLDNFLFSAILLLAATSLAVTLFRHLGLGSVLGLLVAGVAVGPHSPGPQVTAQVDDVRHFTELGVVLLLFLIGLEMRPKRLWALRRQVFGLGSLQILLSGAVLAIYLSLYHSTWSVALLSGLTLALSSTAFVLQLLQERGELASPHGTGAFAVLLMQDLAVVPLLALVPLVAGGDGQAAVPAGERLLHLLGAFALVWLAGARLVPRALDHLSRHGNREGFFLVVMLAVFAAAWGMHEAGVSMALGAFLMGMLLSGSRYSYQIQAHVEPYKGLLMSLFFVAVGMSIDLEALGERPGQFLQDVLVIVALKIAVLYLLAAAFGLGRPAALRIAFLLAQSGEFGFVLFGAAKGLGVIDDETFVVAVAVISATMLLTPLLDRIGGWLAGRVAGGALPAVTPFPEEGEEPPPRVVVAGYGRVGHTVATVLESSGVPYIAFDTRPVRVAEGKRDGRPVYYGDIGDPQLLQAARVGRAELVVITIDHEASTLRAINLIRGDYPSLPIVARARDLEACDRLLQAGATSALPEAVESSLRLAAESLETLGLADADGLLREARSANYALVRETGEER